MFQSVNTTADLFIVSQRRGFSLLLVLTCFLFCVSMADAQPTKRVLLLNSYSYDLAWTASITRGVQEAFATSDGSIKLSVEFMDTKNYYNPNYLSMLQELYSKKYNGIDFDAIITSDDNGVNFALKHRSSIFNDAPIIFCGVNNLDLPESDNFVNITGVLESTDPAATVESALRIDPTLESFYIIVDETPSGKSVRANAERVLSRFNDRINIEWLQGLSMDELKETLATLPQRSAVLLATFTRDRVGNSFTFSEALAHMRSACKRPIYSLFDFYLGDGIIGGMLTSGMYQGTIAAQLALNVMNGENPESIAVVRQKANRYMFDYNELVRFGYTLDTLPPDSVIINVPESTYEKYTYEVWSAVSGFVLLFLIICMLLANIRARRRAESELAELNQYQETLIDQRTEELTQRSKELEMANYELKKLDELKTAVLNTVSHDLRTPLTSVLGFCKIIDRDFQRFFLPLCSETDMLEGRGQRITENLAIIDKEGARLTRLINDFLDLSKIESGSIAWNDVSIEPTELLNQAAPVLSGYFSDTGVRLTFNIESDLPNILVDPDRLLQVLNNLVGNAAKFTYHGEVILDATVTEGGWLKVTISDTGVGIPKEELDRIFDTFYQASQSTKDMQVSRGSGMGLAISKRIVKHYGGTITAESEPGKGSSFIFTIPSVG